MKPRRVEIGLCVWLLVGAVVSAQELTPGSPDILRAALRAKVEAGEMEGAVHLVAHNGRAVFLDAAGYCDLADRKPFRSDSMVRIYSMSKPITSLATMTLYEQGKLQLDDPVARFIPAFEKTTVLEMNGDAVKQVPPQRPITVRDVLRHTTGISYGDEPQVRGLYEREGMRYWGPSEMFPPRMNLEQAAAALARIPALHHPGERFNFCQMLVDGGRFQERTILRPEALQLMFTDQLNGVAGPFRFGLGFEIAQVTLGTGGAARDVMQYSWGGYASTEFCVIPEAQMYQIFVRQHVPSVPEFAKLQFATVRQHWSFRSLWRQRKEPAVAPLGT